MNVFITDLVKVDGPWQPSPDASVGVFDAALLLGHIGVTEVGGGGEHVAQQGVAGEVSAVVEGDRSAQSWSQPLDHGHQRRDGLRRGLAHQAADQGQAGFALMQHQHGPRTLADHQIGFPVAYLFALIGGLCSLGYMNFLGNAVF